MKEFLTGLHRRDCLRGQKWTIYRAGPIWQHFWNKKTSQNRFQEQPNLLLVNQSDFRTSFWKSPDISKVLKDYWSPLGCIVSFHHTTHRVPNKYTRTHFKEETFVENLYMFRWSIFCGCTLAEMKHTDLVYFRFCHLHPPSFTKLSCDIKTHHPKCLIPLSHHPPSNPELSSSPPLQRHLLSLLPTLPRTNLQYCFRPDPRKCVDRNESLQSLPTRQTYDASFSNVLMFGVVDAACSCWVPKKCVKKDVEK